MASARNPLLVVAMCAAFGSACGSEPVPTDTNDKPEKIAPPPYDSLDKRPCPKASVLTWENFGEPFVNNWCTACHSSGMDTEHRAGAPSNVNFDDLDGVRDHMERVWTRAADQNNTMPPAGYPPDEERAQLGEWLACGAKSRAD